MTLFCPSCIHDVYPSGWLPVGEIWLGRKLSDFAYMCFQGWMEQCSSVVKKNSIVVSDAESEDMGESAMVRHDMEIDSEGRGLDCPLCKENGEETWRRVCPVCGENGEWRFFSGNKKRLRQSQKHTGNVNHPPMIVVAPPCTTWTVSLRQAVLEDIPELQDIPEGNIIPLPLRRLQGLTHNLMHADDDDGDGQQHPDLDEIL
jgi:hypothetical protein